ncbi:MAG: phosphatidylinositol kinase Tor2 [Piptocephalis tieghemiana]|nr:MAG: phosphatidylinositol kinase Tor2 [Piptocephalis tieghemiana]
MAREISSEALNKYMNDVNRRIFELMNGSYSHEKLGGVIAIDKLIDFDGEENTTKVTRFAHYLRIVLPCSDSTVMLAASRALGHLARAGGTLRSEFVEFEVRRALEWLQGDRNDSRRHAAVLILKELADNAPTLIYGYVPQYLDSIWTAFRDTKVVIRNAAAEALMSCLQIILKRESRKRQEWYDRILLEAERCRKLATADAIHGSLLIYRNLLTGTGMFMDSRFSDVCELALYHKDNKDPLVRRMVMTLMPTLAKFNPEDFSAHYLQRAMDFLVVQLRKDRDKNIVFFAIGEIAVCVKNQMAPYLQTFLQCIHEGLSLKGKARAAHEKDIFKCLGKLAEAVGPALTQEAHDLLDLMFSAGLTDPLRQALGSLARFVPPLAPVIRARLLNLISLILAGRPFVPPGAPGSGPSIPTPAINSGLGEGIEKDEEVITLALYTLADFDHTPMLHEFVHDTVIYYLDEGHASVRRAAARTACLVLQREPVCLQASAHATRIAGEIIERLLCLGIGDPDVSIRELILSQMGPHFDRHLSQAEHLRALFLALNDESLRVRELAMEQVGRLAQYNPAYVVPALRRTLIQLLTELEYSTAVRQREEAARLLGTLVATSGRHARPYIDAILRVLIPKATDPAAGVSAAAISAIGRLALVGGSEVEPYVGGLMPTLLEALQDQGSIGRREAALVAMGQLCGSTGYVVEPYLRYPSLLPTLIRILKSESGGKLKREATRLLGILGALDPYKLKLSAEAEAALLPATPHLSLSMGSSSEDYYPAVAVTALMRILQDPSLSAYHTPVIQAYMYIFKTLGMRCVPFLPAIMPTFLGAMRTVPAAMLEFHFQQLGILVGIIRHNIRNYLDDIFSLVRDYWSPGAPALQMTILSLVEAVALVMDDEFRVYLPSLLVHMLAMCERPTGTSGMATRVTAITKVLHAFVVFGTTLQEYLHLVVPVLLRLAERGDGAGGNLTDAILTLGRMTRRVDFSEHAAPVVHSLMRILGQGVMVPELREPVMETLALLVYQLGRKYVVFLPTTSRELLRLRISHPKYESLVRRLVTQEPFPPAAQLFGEDRVGSGVGAGASTVMGPVQKLPVDQPRLARAWENAQRSTREDWMEWMRRLSVELLKESPSHALRACASLAGIYPPLARELFNAAFVSCWSQLHQDNQRSLMEALETALRSPNIPPEILNILLNLNEFMEQDEKSLPVDIGLLSGYALKCHAYAKALHYKEVEFFSDPSSPQVIESLISISNHLGQPDAASGILAYAQSRHSLPLEESWYERLQRWDEALVAYERREAEDPGNFRLTLGRMRCLHSLGEWASLSRLSEEKWPGASEANRKAMAALAASAAWGMGAWSRMDDYIGCMKKDSADRGFFRAILAVHRHDFALAQRLVDNTRDLLDTELTALVAESYSRAYSVVVRVQMLSEIEEVIRYKVAAATAAASPAPGDEAGMAARAVCMGIRRTWARRLRGCQRNIDIWLRILKVRSAVISPMEDREMWMRFASLCRKSGRMALSERALDSLMGHDGKFTEMISVSTHVAYAILKHRWAMGMQTEALKDLKALGKYLAVTSGSYHSLDFSDENGGEGGLDRFTSRRRLLSRVYLRMGRWSAAAGTFHDPHSQLVHRVLRAHRLATLWDPISYKAWHAWSLSNFEAIAHASGQSHANLMNLVRPFIVPAIEGFFRSLALSARGGNSLQDTLRLLTLWFKYGYQAEVSEAIVQGLGSVSIDTWLQVIPQLIARIHAPSWTVRRGVNQLLSDVGRQHPQALVYSLTVAMKSHTSSRRKAALSILDKLRLLYPRIVEQALMVSHELIRVSILWMEIWHEGLEEASRYFFGERNPEGMLLTLEPLHRMMRREPETQREENFVQTFGSDLRAAEALCRRYREDRNAHHLNQAWDLYYQVFRKVFKQLTQMTTLDLESVSPRLAKARDLDIAIPGTYRSEEPVISIRSFAPSLTVISSKQRPRKLSIRGSDGKDHGFLLKGHEDLRQDERVMQLFGLVNTLLKVDPETFKRHLGIARYSVVPLSINSGLIGWVPACDTLHALIKEFRDHTGTPLNVEHRNMLQLAPDYDILTLLHKVEVFESALYSTPGDDLYKILWLKSKNSESWLERRTNYTRSLAVMSMVGYVLGLGDRHPSNLMLDRHSGRIIHIDFGDCFEVAIQREKYPEKIPFRLTRMLVKAMEVSGVEGNYRTTCENVMRVLRENKESVMAVLEAFVHDPLINWKLTRKDRATARLPEDQGKSADQRQEARERHDGDVIALGGEEDGEDGEDGPNYQPEANQRAVQVITRVSNKLTGRDFKPNVTLDVPAQVDKLILEARSIENLCQCYIGWCAFW